MKATIITAVFNGAASIATTLQSVARQDYADIEHIVVDGGSTDSTMAIVADNSDRIAKVISEPDSGPYEAFNKGLASATGDAVAFLNSGDTYVTNQIVSTMMRALSGDNFQAAFADVLIVDQADVKRVIRRFSSRKFAPKRMIYGLMPAHPSLFIRREVFTRVGPYDPSFRIAGDFEHCLRVFVKATTSYQYVPEAVVTMPTGGVSNRGWRSKLLITREMYRACAMNGIQTTLPRLCLRFPIKMMELF
jgi:glycosyltransferase involved in cell wall biosynthesis